MLVQTSEMKACFLISECSQASQIFFCKITKYFLFHQIFSQLFSSIPKDLTFPPFAFNTSSFVRHGKHRLTRIIYLGTEIHGFFKDTALAPHDYVMSRHFVVTACLASSRLSSLFWMIDHIPNTNEPCLYFSIAFSI